MCGRREGGGNGSCVLWLGMRWALGRNVSGSGLTVCPSDVECAKGRFVVPRDLDPHQFLQVHVLGHGRRLLHGCGVVDGRDVGVEAPVPVLVSFAEYFVPDALDVGGGLQLHGAFPQRHGRRRRRRGCVDVVL